MAVMHCLCADSSRQSRLRLDVTMLAPVRPSVMVRCDDLTRVFVTCEIRGIRTKTEILWANEEYEIWCRSKESKGVGRGGTGRRFVVQSTLGILLALYVLWPRMRGCFKVIQTENLVGFWDKGGGLEGLRLTENATVEDVALRLVRRRAAGRVSRP